MVFWRGEILSRLRLKEVGKMEVFSSGGLVSASEANIDPDACVCDCTCHPGQGDSVSIGSYIKKYNPQIPY